MLGPLLVGQLSQFCVFPTPVLLGLQKPESSEKGNAFPRKWLVGVRGSGEGQHLGGQEVGGGAERPLVERLPGCISAWSQSEVTWYPRHLSLLGLHPAKMAKKPRSPVGLALGPDVF